jgi:voltage-gated potassium channel
MTDRSDAQLLIPLKSLAAATAKTGARIAVASAIIVGVLAPLPVHPNSRMQAVVLVILVVIIWAAIFVLVFRWQLRRILKASNPQPRMIEALAILFVLFLGVFAKMYHFLSSSYPASFSEPLDFFSASYFALTVLATVGFGDISPVTPVARAVAMTQMVLDLVLLGVAVRIITGAASKAVQRLRAIPSKDEVDSRS